VVSTELGYFRLLVMPLPVIDKGGGRRLQTALLHKVVLQKRLDPVHVILEKEFIDP